jgi:hypothetical protein
VTSDIPPPPLIAHHIWPWLDAGARESLCAAMPIIRTYGAFRLQLPHARLSLLRLPRSDPRSTALSTAERTRLMGLALMSLDFQYGDLIRWLRGDYTAAHRDWDKAFAAIETVRHAPIPPGYPPVDIDVAKRVCTQGAPLRGKFVSRRADVLGRLAYDNHAGLEEVAAEVRAKLIKEEGYSYHLFLPRWFALFIFGLMISPLTWVVRKGKGRLCVDASNHISKTDEGAPNDQIPRPAKGTRGDPAQNPAVHYGTALKRHLTWIWKLRIEHPTDEILQYCDDIAAAFHRILYHPDIATVFAYVFEELLVIPVGNIFGSKSSPSWWDVVAEIRAHLAACGDLSVYPTPLADRLVIPPEPDSNIAATFVPACADKLHPGIPAQQATRPHHSMFVDDNGMAALVHFMRTTIQSSEASAKILFGYPAEDPRRPVCLAEDKWLETVSHLLHYLGFDIDTRRLTMSWPLDKRTQFRSLILSLQRRCAPRDISRILGLLRNAAEVAPLVVYISMRVQFWFNDFVAKHSRESIKPSWWRRASIWPPDWVFDDLQLLAASISDDPLDSRWSRYIGYLVDREANSEILQDAAYEGLGGWSPTFQFMWRLSRPELVAAGFPMKLLGVSCHEPGIDASGLHINLLEFLALIINVWFLLWAVKRAGPRPGGWVVSVRGDNTSALSWMRHSTRARNPTVRHLSRFLVALLLQEEFPGMISGVHIPGPVNVEADCLSRPVSVAPTWASAIEQCLAIRMCQAYLVPPELLSALSVLLSSPKTAVLSAPPTTELLALEPIILAIGSPPPVSPRPMSPPPCTPPG